MEGGEQGATISPYSSSLPLLPLTLCSCSSVGPSHRLQLFRVDPLCHGVFCTGWRGIYSSTLSTSSPSFITLSSPSFITLFYLSLVESILPFLKCFLRGASIFTDRLGYGYSGAVVKLAGISLSGLRQPLISSHKGCPYSPFSTAITVPLTSSIP